MAYADEDLIPISALQHHLFCPRQCALIHVDGLWAENRLTTEGSILHRRSDTPGHRTRPAAGDAKKRLIRGLPLISRRLGITGRADVVEFFFDDRGCTSAPPRPVEHKRGKPKRLDHDRVQLAAQALCLEEMLSLTIPEGELFYNAVRRREIVPIDDQLRSLVERITAEVRSNIEHNHVPVVKKQPKCRSCSLMNLCMPGGTQPSRDPARYLSRSLAASLAAETGPSTGEEP